MPNPGWNGRRVTNAIAYVIDRDNGICQLCQHPGANSLDHIEGQNIRPDLIWEPTNWQATHLQRAGKPRGCQTEGCTCLGNYGKGQMPNDVAAHISRQGHDVPASREW